MITISSLKNELSYAPKQTNLRMSYEYEVDKERFQINTKRNIFLKNWAY